MTRLLLIVLVILKQFVDGRDVFGRCATALVLPKNDVLEREEILQQRNVIVSPLEIVLGFGLEPPDTSKFRRAHFPLPPVVIFLCPYVLTRHRLEILH